MIFKNIDTNLILARRVYLHKSQKIVYTIQAYSDVPLQILMHESIILLPRRNLVINIYPNANFLITRKNIYGSRMLD